ncbi:MAG: PHP-associated domain-containing protein [Methanomicrobiales archaeon]|nr:PHP-associated domain-containing protein [Methanomicrobiales archaeon]
MVKCTMYLGREPMQHTEVCSDVLFSRPVPAQLRCMGLLPVDMHFHTNHSDSPTRVKDALKLADRLGIGLAITDHNQISGVLEAVHLDTGVPVVPGIEVSASDGPHILLYFYSVADLQEFYRRYVERNRRSAPYVAIRLNTQEILDAREAYPCIVSEAHPCGYFFLSQSVERCIDGECLSRDIRSRFDAVEVICGGMARVHNLKALQIAERNRLGRTGGTDGHLLHELGGVVTCAQTESVDEFLDAIPRRENLVIGHEKTIFYKTLTGTAILPHHIPYAFPILRARWEQHLPRIRRYMHSRLNGGSGSVKKR